MKPCMCYHSYLKTFVHAGIAAKLCLEDRASRGNTSVIFLWLQFKSGAAPFWVFEIWYFAKNWLVCFTCNFYISVEEIPDGFSKHFHWYNLELCCWPWNGICFISSSEVLLWNRTQRRLKHVQEQWAFGLLEASPAVPPCPLCLFWQRLQL